MAWRYVDGYTGLYEVNETGLVRNSRRERALSPRLHNNGYLAVNLWLSGVGKNAYVHRLVAKAFVDGFAPGLEVNHKDGNKANNTASNLEWVTRSQNVKHSFDELVRKPNPSTPVQIAGVVYPSMLAAASAHGVRAGAVWAALKHGRLFQGKEICRV